MIQHFTEDGRRVYTADEAARLRGENVKTIQTRLLRAKVEPAGRINPRLAVYYPEDLGIEHLETPHAADMTPTLGKSADDRDQLAEAMVDLAAAKEAAKPLNEAEARMIAAYTAGATLIEVSRQFGVPGPKVRGVLVAAHIPIRRAVHPRTSRKLAGDELQEAVRLYQIGSSIVQVCRSVGGVDVQSMRQQLVDAGVKIREGRRDLKVVLEAAPGTPPGTLPEHYAGRWVSRIGTDLAATLDAFRLTAKPTGRAATNSEGEGAEILEVRPGPGWTPPTPRRDRADQRAEHQHHQPH